MCHPDPLPSASSRSSSDRTVSRVRIESPEGVIPAIFATPPTGTERGRLVIVHDVFGVSPFYEELGHRLADAEFTSLLPDLYHREKPLGERSLDAAYSRLLRADNQLLYRDLQTAADWLREQEPEVHRIGSMGFCWGGTQVLAMAAERTDVATVCYYGMPADPRYSADPTSDRPLDLVPKMSGPVIGFWGDQDSRAGMENVHQLTESARASGARFEATIYPGVGHGFMLHSATPGDPASEAIADAWARTIDFLDSNLDGMEAST